MTHEGVWYVGRAHRLFRVGGAFAVEGMKGALV
jgi:hypothetical protein